MTSPRPRRSCARCGRRLAADNAGRRCGPCQRALDQSAPPVLPAGFWDTEQIRDALASWHMGRVIHAYRTHPFHRQPLTQELVGRWLGLTQAQLSRIENGRAPEELSRLVHYSRTLAIPAHLLWFNLPNHTRPRAAAGMAVAVEDDDAPVADGALAGDQGAPSRQQFLRAASVLGVSAVLSGQRPNWPLDSSGLSATDDPLAALREAVTVATESPDERELGSLTLAGLDSQVQECHRWYQRADYAGAAQFSRQ